MSTNQTPAPTPTTTIASILQILQDAGGYVTLGVEVAGVVMLNHWFQGEAGTATAMSVVQLILTAIIVLFASRVLRVKIYG